MANTVPGTALVPTGTVTACCALHIPGDWFACCTGEDCMACCERCPTCPANPEAWNHGDGPGEIAAAAARAIRILERALP